MPAAQPAGDSLAGRVVGARIFGFSQGERAGRRDDFVSAVLRGALGMEYRSGMGRADYVDLLAVGSMPEVRRLPQRYRADWLESYVSRLLGRDLRELSRLSDPRGCAPCSSPWPPRRGPRPWSPVWAARPTIPGISPNVDLGYR